MAESSSKIVRFSSHKSFSHRLVLATLTGRTIHISRIRPDSPSSPGLAPHEISFLRLFEAITNGSHIEISYTGTTVVYKPGLITGCAQRSGAVDGVIHHEPPATCTRAISYFLIPICILAPFSTSPVNIVFTGPGVFTSCSQYGDISVDSVRTAILPLYRHFGISNNIELRILQRSNCGPEGKGGAGEVQLTFGHQVRLPRTIHLLNPGKVKKIRGVAYCIGVSGSNNARAIEAARGVLNPLTPDVYIFSDVSSAPRLPSSDKSNPSNKYRTGLGFGLSLVAESSTGSLYSADAVSPPAGGLPPEDIGRQSAYELLESISMGGNVSMSATSTVFTLMAMGSEDVGRLHVGRDVIGSEHVVELARDLKAFGTIPWGIREDPAATSGDVIVSVVGKGHGNVGRKIA